MASLVRSEGFVVFARAIMIALEAIDLDSMPKIAGMAPEELRGWLIENGQGVWLTAPKAVTCGHCGSQFATTCV